jgi:phage-related protein
MSQVAGSIVVAIKAVDEASTVFQKIQASFGVLGASLGQLGGGFADLGSIITGFAAGGALGAAAAGVGEVIKGLQVSVEEAQKSQQAWTDLQAQLKLTGSAWDEARSKIGAMAAQLQRTTVYSDEMVVQGIQRLATFGMSWQQASQTISTAIDLAAAKHIDLQTAVDLLGKAFLGNTATIQRYGIDIDGIKNSLGEGATSADLFNAVIGKLNESFGGTAAAQAESYAGTQARLTNAMSDLGEKIGGIILPAITNLAEGLIPVVDWLSQAVDKFQAWLDVVSKMPEVKAASDAVSTALQGLGEWVTQFTSDAATILGPSLQDLWSAFKDLADALAPVGEALGEIFAAFSDGEESGNILKDVLYLIADALKGIALVIRTVAPAIKLMAQAFKDAADFLVPIITTIRDVVGGFLTWLHDAFQALYDFLVGHSLWQDLWDEIVNVARGIGTTIEALLTGAFELWKGVFTVGMQAIQAILTTGFDVAFAVAQVIVGGAVAVLVSLLQPFADLLNSAQATWVDLVGSVATNTQTMKATVQALWDWLVPFWADKISAIATNTSQQMDNIRNKINDASGQMKEIWEGAMMGMYDSTTRILARIYSEMSSRVDAIIARLEDAKRRISSGSIWPDMLSEMLAQTKAGMSAIGDEFSEGLTSPAGIIPTLQATTLPTPVQPEAVAPATAPAAQAITVPVNVYLDGQLIQTFLERRLVESLIQNASRAKRG